MRYRKILLIPLLLMLTGCQPEPQVPPFQPPVLLDPKLDSVVTETRELEVGREAEGKFIPGSFTGYLFEARGETALRAHVVTIEGELRPILLLYGPRSEMGIFGDALRRSNVDASSLEAGFEFEVPHFGEYLLLVTGKGEGQAGCFAIGVHCIAGCDIDCIPLDEICPDLVCEHGVVRDDRGCPICECKQVQECPGGCRPGEVCRGGLCIPENTCLDDYAPVCGSDGKTYANRCEAAQAGIEIVGQGPCPDDCSDPPCPDRCPYGYKVWLEHGRCQCECKTACEACSRDYEPVCGFNGRTYRNRCVAEFCWDDPIAYDGICVPGCPPLGPCPLICEGGYRLDDEGCPVCQCLSTDQCRCPGNDAAGTIHPVCGADGRTYPSACHARCLGVPVVIDRPCPPICYGNEDCPEHSRCRFRDRDCEDVPGIDPARGCPGLCSAPHPPCGNNQVDPDNPGDPNNPGGDDNSSRCGPGRRCVDGRCVTSCPGCPNLWDPVCGPDRHTFANECEARCAGVVHFRPGSCCRQDACPPECNGSCVRDEAGCPTDRCLREECICPAVLEPVCAVGPDGAEATYGNPCRANCAEARIVREGPCECQEGEDCPRVCASRTCSFRCPDGYVTGDDGCPRCICQAPPDCDCPEEIEPVCGRDDRTYVNECAARCVDVEIRARGRCPNSVVVVNPDDAEPASQSGAFQDPDDD